MNGGTGTSFCNSRIRPEFSVLFGQDRIVPIFLATLAVQQKSQVIRFSKRYASARDLWNSQGGKEYQ
ncbi:MAG: hypothetical protein ACRD7E_33220, partial [Bryobacteraceae bacterium]